MCANEKCTGKLCLYLHTEDKTELMQRNLDHNYNGDDHYKTSYY